MTGNHTANLLARAIGEHRDELLRCWERAASRKVKVLSSGSPEITCLLDAFLQEVHTTLLENDVQDGAPADSLDPCDRVNLFLAGEEAIAEKLEQICGNPSARELLALRRELNGAFSEMIRRHAG
jgi:hypothetical protein